MTLSLLQKRIDKLSERYSMQARHQWSRYVDTLTAKELDIVIELIDEIGNPKNRDRIWCEIDAPTQQKIGTLFELYASQNPRGEHCLQDRQ